MNDLSNAIAMLERLPELVTTSELASILRCDRGTVQRMVYRGQLTPFCVGRTWRFDREEVLTRLRRPSRIDQEPSNECEPSD
jgi:excisionase family DNA binding protein